MHNAIETVLRSGDGEGDVRRHMQGVRMRAKALQARRTVRARDGTGTSPVRKV